MGGGEGGFLVRSLVDGAASYSVACRAGLLPTELTGMWGWILLRSPHWGRGSAPAPAPTEQRPVPGEHHDHNKDSGTSSSRSSDDQSSSKDNSIRHHFVLRRGLVLHYHCSKQAVGAAYVGGGDGGHGHAAVLCPCTPTS